MNESSISAYFISQSTKVHINSCFIKRSSNVHIISRFFNRSTNLSVRCSTAKRSGVLPNWSLLFTSDPVFDLDIRDFHTRGFAQNFFDYIVAHNRNVLCHQCQFIFTPKEKGYDAVIGCCSKR